MAFGSVAIVSLFGLALAVAAPAGHTVVHQSAIGAALRRVSRERATRAALSLTLVDVLVFGTVDLLVPLNLGDRGRRWRRSPRHWQSGRRWAPSSARSAGAWSTGTAPARWAWPPRA